MTQEDLFLARPAPETVLYSQVQKRSYAALTLQERVLRNGLITGGDNLPAEPKKITTLSGDKLYSSKGITRHPYG